MKEPVSRQKASKFMNVFENDVRPSRDSYEETWNDAIRLYNLDNMPTDEDSQNSMTTPKTKSIVDTWISTNMAKPPDSRVIPRNETGTEKAQMVSQLMAYAFSKPRNRRGIWDAGWDLAMFGTCFGFNTWRHKTIRTRARDTFTTSDGIEVDEVLETNTVIEDYPELEHVSIWDVWPDPKIPYLDDMRFIYRRRVYSDEDSLNAYMEFFGGKLPSGVTFDDLAYSSGSTATSSSSEQSDKAGRFYSGDMIHNVDVYERWGDDGSLQVVAGQYMVYDGGSPFDHRQIPFTMATINRNNGEVYGKGLPEIYRPIQDALDAQLNTALDNLEFASYPMLITRTNSRLSMYSTIFETGVGAILEDDNPGDVQQLRLSSVVNEHFQMFAVLDKLGSEGISMPAPLMGQVAPGTSKTATGVTAMIDMGMAPVRLNQQKFDVLFMRRVMEQFYWLFKQFMPEDYVVNLIDDENEARVFKASRSMLIDEFDFEPEAGSMNYVDKAGARATWIQLLQILGNPQFNQVLLSTAGKRVELGKLVQQVLSAFGVKHQKEFITDDKEFLMKAKQQAEQQQQLQAMQQPQGMGGGQPGGGNGYPG